MENNYASITFKAKINPLESINNEFTLCKAYVQGIGKNRNGSYMSKENVEQYLSTLNYCPVVGHLFKYTDSDGNEKTAMGGHDWKLSEDWKIIDLTVPYGVVVNDSYNYEVINEYGVDVEYLTAQIILWTGRYPELKDAIYSDDFWFNQSMEINVLQHRPLEEDSNYTEILEWSYSALCLLGKADDKESPAHTEPCFINSKVFPTEFSKNEFTQVMNEMKEKISLCFDANKTPIVSDLPNHSGKGGETLDKKLEILQKFNITVEDLDFSIEDITEEELLGKMDELFGEKVEEPVEFSATYNQKRQALVNALDPIIVKDDDGNYVEETYFYVEDFSDEYVFVEKSYWTLDDHKVTYGRYSYSFDDVSLVATLTSDFEEMVKVWLTVEEKAKLDEERAEFEIKYNSLVEEFSAYKEEHSFLDSDFNTLKEYKENKEIEERQRAEDALFAEYEERIGKTDEFKELKEKSSEYSLESLKKECLYIVGMYSMTKEVEKPETKESASVKFSLEGQVTDDEEPYDGLFKLYLNR